jgi:hypothetical protein
VVVGEANPHNFFEKNDLGFEGQIDHGENDETFDPE